MTKPLIYIDRETGQQQFERIYAESELCLLYQSSIGRFIRALLARSWFSTLNAIPKRQWFSRAAVKRFVDTYEINVDEAEKPIDDYSNLDEFFCRKLKPATRPLNVETNVLCSPADGRALAYSIDKDCKLKLKGQIVDVNTLLQRQVYHELAGGQALVIRLAPKDYHRFHFPADGVASAFKPLPGPLESVHPIALDAGVSSFLNKRTVMHLDTESFGRIYIVAIGALTIGTILHSYCPGQVKRGDEHGYFRFGGSTVVMLWGKTGPDVDTDIWANTNVGYETLVNYGMRIATV